MTVDINFEGYAETCVRTCDCNYIHCPAIQEAKDDLVSIFNKYQIEYSSQNEEIKDLQLAVSALITLLWAK